MKINVMQKDAAGRLRKVRTIDTLPQPERGQWYAFYGGGRHVVLNAEAEHLRGRGKPFIVVEPPIRARMHGDASREHRKLRGAAGLGRHYTDTRHIVAPGRRYTAEMPYSEVMMHMRVAGKRMQFELLPGRHAVQLYTLEGRPFSSAVLPGEAGLYAQKVGGKWFYYASGRGAGLQHAARSRTRSR